MSDDLAYAIRYLLMERYRWTWDQVADIPGCLLHAFLDT